MIGWSSGSASQPQVLNRYVATCYNREATYSIVGSTNSRTPADPHPLTEFGGEMLAQNPRSDETIYEGRRPSARVRLVFAVQANYT